MNSTLECRAKLLNLQKYLPFMQRIMGQLASVDIAECQKIKKLIDVITIDLSLPGNLRQ